MDQSQRDKLPQIQQKGKRNNKSLHLYDNKSNVSEESCQMISQFRKTNDPFFQGFSRSSRIVYQGSPDQRKCTRLNEFYTISSFKHTNHSQLPQTNKKIEGVRNLRSTFQKNKIMEDIIEEEDFVLKNQSLCTNINKLWKNDLLKKYDTHIISLPKNQSINFVYNDYHSRATNPGYARNTMGCFYCR